jgi:hypothetical protein
MGREAESAGICRRPRTADGTACTGARSRGASTDGFGGDGWDGAQTEPGGDVAKDARGGEAEQGEAGRSVGAESPNGAERTMAA